MVGTGFTMESMRDGLDTYRVEGHCERTREGVRVVLRTWPVTPRGASLLLDRLRHGSLILKRIVAVHKPISIHLVIEVTSPDVDSDISEE